MIVDLIFRGALGATDLGGHYANDNSCSKNETGSGGRRRFSTARGDRSHRVLRRKCQTGGAFLSERARFSATGLQRSGNRRERSRQLRGPAEQDHVRPDDADAPESSGRRAPSQAWRRRESDRVESERRDLFLERNDQARRQKLHGTENTER